MFFVTWRAKGALVCPTGDCREDHLAAGTSGDHPLAGVVVNLTGSRGSWKVPKTVGSLIQVWLPGLGNTPQGNV